jgi:splicing factor 3B subunit 1
MDSTVINALRSARSRICRDQARSWRLNHKMLKTRQQVVTHARIAIVAKACGEEKLLTHLFSCAHENIGEEYRKLRFDSRRAGSDRERRGYGIDAAADQGPPPAPHADLCNRYEKVQENCIDFVGRIADRGGGGARRGARVDARLLDLRHAESDKKAIRRATVNTFGHIAKAIGPSEAFCHAARQPESAGAAEPRVHNSCDRDRCGRRATRRFSRGS